MRAILASPYVLRLGQALLLGLCFVAGYFAAVWWSTASDTTPLERLCARVDYVNGLEQELEGQLDARQEVRDELKLLVEECRRALASRTEEDH